MKKAFCENCGSKIEDGAHFCCVCGFKFENDDEVIENFADISSQTDITLIEEMPAAEKTENVIKTAPQEIAALKKPAYKFEKFLLIISAICAVCSLAFYFVVANFGGIPMVNKFEESYSDIPVLTVDMAEEILNNATSFPYYYFEERDMLNKNDYVIHPDSQYFDNPIKCYAVDGIADRDDYYSYFEKYGTREFIEENLSREFFFQEKNGRIYFVENYGMGWYPYTASSMCVEKIDGETYWVFFEESTDEGVILKYIDGAFKATTISPKEAAEPYNDKDATIYLPDIQLAFGSSLDSVEKELKKVGLKLDRNNIVYVKAYWGGIEDAVSYVTGFQKSYKKYKPGDSVGVIVAVEDPEFFRRGAENAETIPELTAAEAENILNAVCNFSLIYFHDNNMIDDTDTKRVTQPDFGYECNAYSVVGIETKKDYIDFLRQYGTVSRIENSYHSDYMIIDGKIYFHELDGVGDSCYAKDWLVIEKIDDATYFVKDTFYMREHIIAYIDGRFKVTDITVDTVRKLYSSSSEAIKIPNLDGKTISEAETELIKAGLKLDRSNMTRVTANGWDGTVIMAKNSWKNAEPGTAVGVYVCEELKY